MQPFAQRLWTTALSRVATVASRTASRPVPGYICSCAPRVRLTTFAPRWKPAPASKGKASKAAAAASKNSSKAVSKVPKASGHAVRPPAPIPAGARGAFNPVVQRFAGRASPQLLYQAPSPWLYMTGCYLIGGCCLAYVAFNTWTVLIYTPMGLKHWVVVATGGIILFVAAFGVYVFRRAYRLVRTVSVLPTAGPGGHPALKLQVESFSMLPGLRPRPLVVPYEYMSCTGRFYRYQKPETEEEKVYREFLEQEAREWERNHILSLPFRQAWDKIRRFFRFMRGIFTDDGFEFLKVRGMRGQWRLDEKPAWILEAGKPFDALVKQRFSYGWWDG